MTGRGSQLDCLHPVAGLCEPGALRYPRALRPRGFTLIELLITVSIIAIMASMILFALYGAGEAAKTAKTRALIVKLDAIIKAKWESYQTRRVPVDTTGLTPTLAARARLNGLRDLMRMEMPDRWSDVVDVTFVMANQYTMTTTPAGLQNPGMPLTSFTKTGIPQSGVWRGYVRRATTGATRPSLEFQNAECLYQIVMGTVGEDGDAREVFRAGDIADIDGDGFPEFVDGWQRPIRFLRWAPGFQKSDLQIVGKGTGSASTGTLTFTAPNLPIANGSFVGGAVIPEVVGSTSGSLDPTKMVRITGYKSVAGTVTISYAPTASSFTGNFVITAPDPTDPIGVSSVSFAMYPLIYSAGPDKAFGIVTDNATTGPVLAYATGPSINTCLTVPPSPPQVEELIGNARDIPGEPNYVPNAWADNIHNHLIGLR